MQSVSIPLDYMIVARIDEGEDILNSIKQLVVEHKVQAGMFTLIGAVDRAEYGFYIPENKAYTTHVWEPSPKTSPVLEIVACLGNVAQSKGEPIIHAHITFTGVNGEVIIFVKFNFCCRLTIEVLIQFLFINHPQVFTRHANNVDIFTLDEFLLQQNIDGPAVAPFNNNTQGGIIGLTFSVQLFALFL